MRARNLKPALFKNEILGTADPLLTILFEGLWCEADREGRLEDRPVRIRAEVFPYRPEVDIETQLQWLHDQGFIKRYTAKSLKIIQIVEFPKHQRPHKNEVKSELPTLDEASTTKVRRTSNQGHKSAQPRQQALRSDSGLLTPSSLTPDSGLMTPDCLMVPSEPMSDAEPSDAVESVFDHWRSVHHHPQAVLDIKRRALIGKTLRGFSADSLRQSISGYRNSPHHMGQNDSGTKYDSIELMLRDAARVEKGIKFFHEPPNLQAAITRKNIASTADWEPPELRNANN